MSSELNTPENEDAKKQREEFLFYHRPTFMYRAGWNAVAPKSTEPLAHPTPIAVYMFTSTEECLDTESCIKIVNDLQSQHISQGLPDIKYNFLIGGDAVIYEGRGWHAEPHKDPSYAKYEGRSIHVAYIGDFTVTERIARLALLAALLPLDYPQPLLHVLFAGK